MPENAGPTIGASGEFRPRTGSLESWNAAYLRVEDYLRAHRLENRLHQSRLIQKILERAAERHRLNPGVDPTTLAAEETGIMMDEWFGKVIGEHGAAGDRNSIDGRVALLLCDGPQNWPYDFLDQDHVSPDFEQAMRSRLLQAGPNLSLSSMVPRPIDLGRITEAAGETLERFTQWPILRTILLWVLFSLVLAGIFYLSR